MSKSGGNKSAIIRETADNKRKTLMQRRHGTKYVNFYAELLTEVKEAWTKAGMIYRKQVGNPMHR